MTVFKFTTWNQLIGTFPGALSDAWSALSEFVITGNKIEGNVETLFSFKNLTWLEAIENKWTGSLPESMTGLKYLGKMIMS